MGTWGPGNLECDGVQDLIAENSDELFSDIIKLLSDPLSAEFDEIEYDYLFFKAEMILALAEKALISSSPEPSELKPLFEKYLIAWYEYYKDSGATEEQTQNRKNVISNTFANLLKVTEARQGGSFFYRINLITDKMDKY